MDGYGPYKPVPPPKQGASRFPQQQDSFTPPPYRMPPYPLYNETPIPGAAGVDQPLATSSPATQQEFQTHSSKFPIEREIILNSGDKNSKIPILHEYKKRNKGVVAPDLPPKQMSAWVQPSTQILSPDQTHPIQNNDPNTIYRTNFIQPQESYILQAQTSTGAVHKQNPQSNEYGNQNNQLVTVQIEPNKETNQKDTNKNKSMTKTYHTLKGMISSRFKSNKETEEKTEDAGLNNAQEDTRSRVEDNKNEKKTDQSGFKPRADTMQQHQYNQHVIQQHILAQQAQQQFQVNHQIKMQHQQTFYQQQQHLVQARSQELLVPRSEEQLYYQGIYGGISQNRGSRIQQGQNYGTANLYQNNDLNKQNHIQPSPERRSIQQIEREQQKAKAFEARRAASHPHLLLDEENVARIDPLDNRPQPQAAASVRRGSYGNLVDAQIKDNKESDDGGFLQRNGIRKSQQNESSPSFESSSKDEEKVVDALQGSPRKKLETEIGKIEGVYNVAQRTKSDEEMKMAKKNNAGSATSSDYDRAGQSSSNVDSGRGSAAYSSGRRATVADLNSDIGESSRRGLNQDTVSSGHDSEWVDVVEHELRNILEPKLHELSLHGHSTGIANSTISESISSMTPPLPPLSPGDQSSPTVTPRNSTRCKHSSLPYGSKPEYDMYKNKNQSRDSSNQRWNGNALQKNRYTKKSDHSSIFRGKQMFGLDTTDLTSTTTRSLDLESMLDGQSESDEDLSIADARTIRKQLEGLETMYSEVLKLLGVKKGAGRYQPSDPRFSKRRYGSMSSLPSSSVSSRPMRDKRREERKKVRDLRGINKRFQRLESHVVTLARSVAHLSSEMRTQHIMIQEMENIRGEIAALRTQTNMLNVRSQSASRQTNANTELPNLANPTRVKKLTKFFGDEPPLLRLFLRKLGYEKYASLFENEKIGMVELPYLTEERLQKMGVPLGPRLRIMQEAQISVCEKKTLCIV